MKKILQSTLFVLALVTFGAGLALAQFTPPTKQGSNEVVPFQPYAATITLAATTSSVNSVFTPAGNQVMVTNASTGIAYIRFCPTSACTAVLTDFPVLAGQQRAVTIPATTTYVAVIDSVVTSGNVYFSPGSGID